MPEVYLNFLHQTTPLMVGHNSIFLRYLYYMWSPHFLFVCMLFFLPERENSIVWFFALIFASDANAAFLQVLSKVCCIRVMWVRERERERERTLKKLHFVDWLHKVDLYAITRYSLSCSLKGIVCLMLTAWHTFIISKK